MYKQAAPEAGAQSAEAQGAEEKPAGEEKVVDADFEEVK